MGILVITGDHRLPCQEASPNLGRRSFLSLLTLPMALYIMSEGKSARADRLPVTLQSTDSNSVQALRASQKIFLNGILYKDVQAYSAFTTAVQMFGVGKQAADAFDKTLQQYELNAPKFDTESINDLLNTGMFLDCVVQTGSPKEAQSLRNFLSAEIPNLGFQGILARANQDQETATPSAVATDIPVSLAAASINLFAIDTSQDSDALYKNSLTVLQGDGNLSSILASSLGAIAQTGTEGNSSSVQGLSKSTANVPTGPADIRICNRRFCTGPERRYQWGRSGLDCFDVRSRNLTGDE